MKRVYVAGSSHEIDRVRAAMAMVRALGCEVTFDWTEDVEQLGSNPASMPIEERAGYARKDFVAIDRADVVWLLAPVLRPSRGACAEWGYAIAKGKPTLLTGPENARRSTIFFDLADSQIELDADGVEPLRALAWCPHKELGHFWHDGCPACDGPSAMPACADCNAVGGPLVECVVCGRTKAPFGRSAPLDSWHCERECEGHMQAPHAGQLWPGERWGDSLPCVHARGRETTR